MERRVSYEEEAFGAKLRQHAAPEDYFKGGKVKPDAALPLFKAE
jgi:hypothetical protein